MKNLLFILFVVAAFFGCNEPVPEGYKLLKTEGFEIIVPNSWEYEKVQGIDSFIGIIKGNGVHLSFDMSDVGLANNLIPSELEYIHEERDWFPVGKHPYMKVGVTYTTGDVEKVKNEILATRSINDSSEVKVEKVYYPDEEILFKNGNYTAVLTYKDTVLRLEIEIPEKIKQHTFTLDTIGNLYRKIITPKSGVKGMIGVYYSSLDTPFNFNIVGRDMNKKNQEEAVKAFKTIKFLKWVD